jgi:hypothetical protein
MEHHAPHNLYDLWALGERSLIGADALEVFVRSGPTGHAPADWIFESVPDDVIWQRSLGHQTRLRVTAAEALASVRTAWESAV